MRIWIDLAHPPHPLLFGPIARRLEELGHEVRVTARDSQGTLELALERFPDADAVGGVTPRSRPGKAAAIAARVAQLRRWARRRKPELALSHNSYAQIAAARTLGIRAVTAMDFEFQRANHLAFRLAHRILLPDALPAAAVRHQGATPAKVRHYEGLKEEIYLGEFEPHDVVAELGVQRAPDTVVVVARTPPSRASYHRAENRLFFEALRLLDEQAGVRLIVLLRHPEQTPLLEAAGVASAVVPERPIDSRALMYAADLVLGGGGTMTREAALLGVPTFSAYAEEVPAVDRWLEARSLLRRLERPSQVAEVRPRQTPPRPAEALRARSTELTRAVVDLALDGKGR